jgi:hypothetical protein
LKKGHISGILGTPRSIKLKLIGYIAWDVELVKSHYVHVTTTAATTIICIATTTKAKGIKVKI